MDFLEPAHYVLNALTLPMAITGLAILGFGIWVFTMNRYDRLHRDFFVVCCLLTGWLLSQALTYTALQPQEAGPLSRIIWAFALFIAPASFALATSILGYTKLRERVVPILFIIAAVFLPVVTTDWFISGAYADFYPHAPVPRCGPLNYPYLIIFATTCLYVLVLYYQRLKNPHLSTRDRDIFRLVFVATAIGNLSIVDWLQCLYIPFPPLGFLPIFIWIALVAYTIFKYRLFQITLNVAAPTIIEALPGALFVTNTKGEIVIVNPGAQSMSGENESALLSQNILKLLPASEKILSGVLSNTESSAYILNALESFIKTKDGKEVPVSLSARVARRPDGIPNSIIFIAVEITRLREQMALAERQKAELVKVVEEMGRTQKVLAGRENRLAELKKELDELKHGQGATKSETH